MTPFTQEDFACRCEWGPDAVTALAPADVIIVVDVFSFTTCVDVAVSRGVAILPYAWNDPSAAEYATAQGAELAGKRRKTRYSLAPESYLDAPAGLRCVLPSPNGARVTLAAAASGAVVLAGCLRNARAVAAAAAARRPDLQRGSSRRAMAGWRTAARARGRARRRGNPRRAARVAVAGS